MARSITYALPTHRSGIIVIRERGGASASPKVKKEVKEEPEEEPK
jgi:hypothetical protein